MQFLLLNQEKAQNCLVSVGSRLLNMLITLTFCNHFTFPVRESGKNAKYYTDTLSLRLMDVEDCMMRGFLCW